MDLFEVGVEGAELKQLLMETEGEMTPELEQRYDEFLKGGKDKINSAVRARKWLEAQAEFCRQEANRMWARAKMFEANREQLSQRILFAVDEGFDGKLKTATFTIYGYNAADSYQFMVSPDIDMARFSDDNPDLVRVTRELNKVALKELLKDGGLPPEIAVDVIPGKRVLGVR